ncbi:MAG: SdpI family protein [Terriglobales bacterium]
MVLPLTGCGLTLLFTVLPILRPSAANERTAGSMAYQVGWIGALLLLAVCHVLIVMQARHTLVEIPGDMTFFVAILIVAVGNFLGKTEPNSLVGIRTWWALSSDYAWEKTNRAAGRMFVAAGLVGLGTVAVTDRATASRILIGAILLTGVAAVFLSYYYWRTDPDRSRH